MYIVLTMKPNSETTYVLCSMYGNAQHNIPPKKQMQKKSPPSQIEIKCLSLKRRHKIFKYKKKEDRGRERHWRRRHIFT